MPQVPTELREQFAQLWCSFAAMDKTMAAEVSGALTGVGRGGVWRINSCGLAGCGVGKCADRCGQARCLAR